MKKILITGLYGFLGDKFRQYLEFRNVRSTDYNEHPERVLYEIAAPDKKLNDDFTRDIKRFNFEHIRNIKQYKLEGVDHVFHLAARVSVTDSWDKPFEYYSDNVMGTVNVLEFCRKTGTSMTYINSYPYGMPQYLPIDENHPINPNSPYNHSKQMGEEVCAFYAKNYGVNVTVLRLFNVYGVFQSEDFIISKIVKQSLDSDSKFIKVDNIEPKRDYVYIADVVRAMEKTIELKGYNVYNIGSGKSYSVKELCDIAIDLKPEKMIFSENKKRKNEIDNIVADISKAKKELDWEPETDIEQGIGRTIVFTLQDKVERAGEGRFGYMRMPICEFS